jgi:alpha-glucosidase
LKKRANWWTSQLTNYLAQYRLNAIWNDLTEPNENAMPLDNLWYLDGRYGELQRIRDDGIATIKTPMPILPRRLARIPLQVVHPVSRRPFVLTRGAWPGVQAYAAGWSGDNKSALTICASTPAWGLA